MSYSNSLLASQTETASQIKEERTREKWSEDEEGGRKCLALY
jgi:hypothetical protein